VPFKTKFANRNVPRTIVGVGTSLLDRVNYFTLTNTSANLSYNWKETSTKSWDFSPAFMNIIRLPYVSDSFQRRLDSNDFLKNSYRETFIEGENLSLTYSNQLANRGRSYTYAKIGIEEAGALMGGLDNLNITNINYSQYVKLDFDVRRYINRRRSQLAGRFYGGVGLPYGSSTTLPYVKQYFVGGAYSIRGWRIRTLGPGSHYDPADEGSTGFIDRTGDIKLEMNGEYRFDVVQLFSGSIKLKGAVFGDAGNIWLAQPSIDYPNGEFSFKRFGGDIAVSAGAGARLDVAGFFIFRMDGAIPVKVPYNSAFQYGGWRNPFDNPKWLSDVVLNFAIGYPF
jgi:outer membrane protein assembly factor BamA